MSNTPCARIESDTLPLGHIPPTTMTYYRAVDIGEKDGSLIVAMDDPDNVSAIDDLTKITGKTIIAQKADREQLQQVIGTYLDTYDNGKFKHLKETMIPKETDADIIKAVNMILVEGIKVRATEIALHPSGDCVDLRYRTPSGETKVTGPRIQGYPAMVRRIKVMSQIPLDDNHNPQSGSIRIKALGEEVDIRVDITPGSDGETVVMTLTVMTICVRNECQQPIPKKGTARITIEADTEALGYIPPTSMIYYHAVDIGEKDGCLIVATEEPDNKYLKQDIELITGRELMLVKADREQLKQVIGKYLDTYEDGQHKHLKDTMFKDA